MIDFFKLIVIRLQYHVIEQTRLLPAYSMYSKVDPRDVKQPNGYVTFSINERVQRVRAKLYKILFKMLYF